jgi:hypothetical protein
VSALRRHLSDLGVAAWSKPDPAAINVDVPEAARRLFLACSAVFKRYGSVIYCAAWIASDTDPGAARSVVQAFLIFMRSNETGRFVPRAEPSSTTSSYPFATPCSPLSRPLPSTSFCESGGSLS